MSFTINHLSILSAKSIQRSTPIIEEISNVSAAWLFDETSGTIAYDGSGNNANSTTLNGATISSGKFGNCRVLGSNGIKFGTTQLIGSGVQPFTISGWIYLSPMSLGAWCSVFRLRQDSEFNIGIWYHNDSYTSGQTKYTMTPDFRGNAQYAADVTPYLNVNQWNHIAVAYNGGSKGSSSSYLLYVNGQLVTNRYGSWGTMGGAVNENTFGVDSSNGSDVIGGYILPRIDQTFITKQVLTSTTIQNIYNNKITVDSSRPGKVQIISP